MGHTHKTVKGEKSRQHQTAQNSNIVLTGSGISLPSRLPPPSPRWAGGESRLYLWRGTARLLVALAVAGAALAVGVGLGAALGLAGAPGAAAGMGQAGCMCRRHRQAAAGRRSARVSMLLGFDKVSPRGEPPSEPCSHRLSPVSTPSAAAQTQWRLHRPCHQRTRLGLRFTGHADNGINNVTVIITLKWETFQCHKPELISPMIAKTNSHA